MHTISMLETIHFCYLVAKQRCQVFLEDVIYGQAQQAENDESNTKQFPNGIEATPNRGQSPTYVTGTCLNLQAASLIPTYGKYQLKRVSLPLDYSHLGVE